MTPMWKISTGKIFNSKSTGHCPFTVRETSKRVISIPVIETVNMKLKAQHLPEYQTLKYQKYRLFKKLSKPSNKKFLPLMEQKTKIPIINKNPIHFSLTKLHVLSRPIQIHSNEMLAVYLFY